MEPKDEGKQRVFKVNEQGFYETQEVKDIEIDSNRIVVHYDKMFPNKMNQFTKDYQFIFLEQGAPFQSKPLQALIKAH